MSIKYNPFTGEFYKDETIDLEKVSEFLSGGDLENILISGYLAGPSNFVIDPAAIGNNTGKVIIAGDLQVDGNTTTINSTTLTINDKTIVLASGAQDAFSANKSGIFIDGANASIVYTASNDSFTFNKDIHSSSISITNLTATTADINGGTIDGSIIGGDIPAQATFTNVTASGTIDFSGSTVSDLGTVTTVNIDGGTIDGVALGTNSAITEAQIDNININGNAIISTNIDGNIELIPSGTGEVDISKVDIDAGTIDGTTIGANSAAAGTFTDLTATGNIVVTGTVDGRDIATDGAKLDLIEAGATADQTGAEIKALYEAEADTNAFTDAEKTKLTNIETGATADQTGAEIKALYEAEADTNAFTDAEKTKLTNIETGATADQTAEEIRTLVDSATDSNVFTDAEKDKLSNIAPGATGDQTGAEIKSLYEAEADTNAFTDVEKAKLTGIEANADVTDSTNVEAAGALMDNELTDITAVKAINQGLATTDSPLFTGLTANTVNIDGGTIDGATITTSDITVDAGKTLDVSAGTLILANNQISGDKVEGGIIDTITINTLTSTTGNITTVNATTVDSTNLEVTNIKAKDGTSAGSIADSTGVVTLANSVLTTTDINGGTIDGTVIGGTTPAAGSFTTGQFGTSLNVDGTVTADGLTVSNGAIFDGGDTTIDFSLGTGRFTTPSAFVFTIDDDNNSTDQAIYFRSNAGQEIATFKENGDFQLYEDTGVTPKLFWDASAETLTVGASSGNTNALRVVQTLDGTSSRGLSVESTTGHEFGIYRDANSDGAAYLRNNEIDTITLKGGNVGIGTDSPAGTLHLKDAAAKIQLTNNVNTGSAEMAFRTTTGSNRGFVAYNFDSDYMNFRTGGSGESMRIDASGNVGIGTDSPLSTIHVEKNASGNWLGRFRNTSTTNGYGLMVYAGDDENVQSFKVANHQGSGNYLVVRGDGNIGIGTDSPDTTLNVVSSVSQAKFEGSEQGKIIIEKSETKGFSILSDAAGTLSFYDNNSLAERMRLDPSGNLLVGKIASDGSVVGIELTHNNIIVGTRDGDTSQYLNRLTSDGEILAFQKDGGTVGSIGTVNGLMYIETGDTGLTFDNANNSIFPSNAGTVRDGGIDLGLSSARFKDFYLSGNIIVDGTVDGRDIAADGSKLDGIESGATADQTASEILTAIKTVDGTNSGLDADLLDGQEGTYYLDFTNATNKPDPTVSVTLTGDVAGFGSATLTDLANGSISITAELSDTGVVASTYGSSSEVPVITVDADGRVTNASSVSVAGVNTFTYDSASGVLTIGTADGGSFDATIDLNAFSTTDLAEGTNLYYTDTRVRAVLSADSIANTSYVDTAEADAKAYTDTRETAITTAYQTYADQAESDAETAAAAYTDAQITNNVTNKLGAANGIAELDATGKVSAAQLPSYVDDVLEYTNEAGFPGTGETAKLYVALDTNDVYRWSGSAYIKVSDAVSTADNATKLATARTIALGGDVSGSANFDGSTNITITATVADDSHTHDGRYYTETEADNRFVNVTGDTMSGRLTMFTSNVQPPSSTDATTGARFVLYPLGSGRDYAIGIESNTMWFNSDDHYKWYVDGTKKFEWDDTAGNLKVGSNAVFHDGYHPNADKWTTARTLSLTGDVTGSTSWDGSGNASITATVANDSHTHDTRYTLIDEFDWRGVNALTSTTTSALKTELLNRDVFDSYVSAFKTTWSYASNGNLTDAGRLTELAGTSWLTWTDNSSDNVQGNFTALVIAPNTGGSAGKMFVYNDQGSGYSPGWREIWTSTSDGSGSGLDADLLDGQHGSYYATASHNHTYNVNDEWLRDNGDNAHVKLYGNTRQMAFRTDGTTEFASGVGAYPFAWMYGGDAASQRLMLLNTSGDMWTSTNGWLSTALAGKLSLSGGSLTGTLNYRMLSSQDTSNLDTCGDSSGFSVFYGTSSATSKPSGTDHSILTLSYSSDWQTQLAGDWRTKQLYYRTQENGTWKSWATIWHSDNDGSGSGLDADLLDGYHASTSATGNTIVQRNASGHIYGNYILGSYFNASSGNSENPTIGQIWTQNTADNYLRKSTPAHFISQLGLWTSGNDGSGSGLDADLLDGYHLSGATSVATKIFNNKGQNHSTYTNFNTVMSPGPNYIQQGNNGPTGVSGHQFYGFMFGLGDDYGTSTGSSGHYASQMYYPRAGQGGDPYLYFRDMESGTWGSWRKVYAGYADSAGNADTVDSIQASSFLRSDADDTASGNITFSSDVTVSNNLTATTIYNWFIHNNSTSFAQVLRSDSDQIWFKDSLNNNFVKFISYGGTDSKLKIQPNRSDTVNLYFERDYILRLESLNGNAVEGPIIDLFRNSSTPAGGDRLGAIDFSGKNSSSTTVPYASIISQITDVTAATNSGLLRFEIRHNGAMQGVAEFEGDIINLYKNTHIYGNLTATGDINFGSTITFEGSTDDSNETTLLVTDPTVDRTVILPDQSGTMMLWGRGLYGDPGVGNIAIGDNALASMGGGAENNIAIGANALDSVSTGDGNIGIGYNAGSAIDMALNNIAIGQTALDQLTSGYGNVAVGVYSSDTTTGGYNTAVGLASGPDGFQNNNNYQTCLGAYALATGDYCISIGYRVADYHTSNYTDSSDSVFIGSYSGRRASGASYNVGVGSNIMATTAASPTADHNVLLGYNAGNDITSGGTNVFVGSNCGLEATTASTNVFVGYSAGRYTTTGTYHTFVGAYSGHAQDASANYTGSNLVAVGKDAKPSSYTASNEITLGDTNIATLRCNVTTISSLSDERDKTDITDIGYGLDFIKAMRPVEFTWDRRDGTRNGVTDIGFIAQELAEVEYQFSSGSRTRLVQIHPDKFEADPMRTYPIMVKAMQEMAAKIEQLEARISQLEGA